MSAPSLPLSAPSPAQKTIPAPASAQPLALPVQLHRGGFNLEQIVREGDVAIYRQTKAGQSWEAFEVIRIGQAKEKHILGRLSEAHETYPSTEEWGTRGWTYRDRESAWTKLRELIAREVR